MNNKKTGTSMSNIIVTKKASTKKRIEKEKSNLREKRAGICISCKWNKDGYCKKYKSWCGRVNYICLKIKNPYATRPLRSNLNIKDKRYKKEINKKLGSLLNKYNENPTKVINELKKKYKIK